MFYKTSLAFTLIELTIASAVILIITSTVIVLINPTYFKQKSNDTQRVKNLSLIFEAINEYKFKNKTYPGENNVLYKSNSFILNTKDWIPENLNNLLPYQFVDPINKNKYIFEYIHNDSDFEINAVLEIKKDTMENDKGNNANKFEMGTDLYLLD